MCSIITVSDFDYKDHQKINGVWMIFNDRKNLYETGITLFCHPDQSQTTTKKI